MSKEYKERFEKIVDYFFSKNYVDCLTLLFPMLDKAAKHNYPRLKVGARNRKLFDENESFIWWIMSDGQVKFPKNSTITFSTKEHPKTLGQILYGILRNDIIHDVVFSDEIELDDLKLRIGPRKEGGFYFPTRLIWAMILIFVYQPTYNNCCPENFIVDFGDGCQLDLREMWGCEQKVRKEIEVKMLKQ